MKSYGIRVGRNPMTDVFTRSRTDTGTTHKDGPGDNRGGN